MRHFGPPTASVAPKRPVAQAAAKPKLICRRDENVGTILPQRVCRTAANWRVEDHRTAGDTDLFISHRDNSTGLPTTKN